MKNASLLGSQMMFPSFEIVRLRAAIDNVKLDEIPEGDYDLDLLIGKSLTLVVDIEQVGGLYINKVTNFLPLGKAEGGWAK